VILCFLALIVLTTMSAAQQQQLCPTRPLTGYTSDVTTWHYDYCRTGWQQNETMLSPGNNWSNFGLLWQWNSQNGGLQGGVLAQPLAVNNVLVPRCGSSCPNAVFVATSQDMLYAFNATSNTGTQLWSPVSLTPSGGTYINCVTNPDLSNYAPCGPQGAFSGASVGVTGTPVIDVPNNVLYVVSGVDVSGSIAFYLYAINITTGAVITHTQIQGSVANGHTGAAECTSQYPNNNGGVTFNPTVHIQRSGLLLLNGLVYVAFAPYPEINNGWLFAYQLQNGALVQKYVFVPTPYGTGGGIWGSGAGPATDGSNIFLATGNGTTFDPITQNIPVDVGDSLLKLSPGLVVSDFYAPVDAGYQRCHNDLDFGSGGVLLPPAYKYTGSNGNCAAGCSVVINADKESNLYVTNQQSLGGFKANGGNNIEAVLTPCQMVGNQCETYASTQGYWSSSAFWFDGTNYWLYYVPGVDKNQANPKIPFPLNAYQLATGGSGPNVPISQVPYASTQHVFCYLSPTPSVSSNPNSVAGSGVLWVMEHNNQDNPKDCDGNWTGHVALHAISATPPRSGAWQDLYNSYLTSADKYIGFITAFPTPTVFNGLVYMGTQSEVDIFGPCTSGPNGCMQ